MHPAYHLLSSFDFRCTGYRLQGIDWMLVLHQLEHSQFFFHRRITERELHHEPIELCFGQRKGAFVINWVLCCDHDKRWLKQVCDSVCCNSGFCHRFKQGCLGSRGRTIDFIGKQDLSEDRSRSKLKLSRFLIENRCARDVGREEVGCALNAFELASDTASESPC